MLKTLFFRAVIRVLFTVRRTLAGRSTAPPRRVLILDHTERIGDIVALTPFIERLVAHLRPATVAICLKTPVIDIQRDAGTCDDYIPYQSFGATLRTIRRARYDLIVIPDWGIVNALLALLSLGMWTADKPLADIRSQQRTEADSTVR